MSDAGRWSGPIVHFVRHRRSRRWTYVVAALVLAVLTVWPPVSVGRAKLLPQDSSSAGLGQIINSLGGQLSNFASLLTGGRPPNDLYLIIGRSDPVADDVIADLHLVGPGRRYPNARAAKLDLDDKIDVHLLLGGVVEVEAFTHDEREALALTGAYVRAISKQIGQLGRQTIKSKAAIVAGRFRQATERVNVAAANLDTFRRANNLPNFEQQLGSQVTLRTNLQAQIEAKLVELQMVEQSSGPDSARLHAIQAEVAGLRAQLASSNPAAAAPADQGLSTLQSRYLNLYRDYRFAQSLYDVYSRAVEQTEVESLVSETATYIQIVEPAHLDSARHYNVPAVALLAALILLALFTEVYAPATGLGWRDLMGRADHDELT